MRIGNIFHEENRREEGPKRIIIERLHFDKSQASQYESLVEIHHKTINQLDQQIGELRNKLFLSLKEENTMNKDSIQNALLDSQRKIEIINYSHFQDIKKICKPDQLNYFNELTAELAELFNKNENNPRDTKD